MKIHQPQQGSLEWRKLRAGIPTASEFDALVTPDGKVRTGEMPKTYMALKLAERWLGHPVVTYQGGGSAFQGSLKEEEAVPALSIITERKIVNVSRPDEDFKRVMFITDDEGSMGCSPDGMFEDGNGGAEIKSPNVERHCKYLMEGTFPKDYVAQVQGSMLVTGAAEWVFVSYARNIPPLIMTIKRDEEFIETLATAIRKFNAGLAYEFNRLVELNGGPPRRNNDI